MIITRRLGPGMLTKGLIRSWVERIRREFLRFRSYVTTTLRIKSKVGS